MKRHMSYRLLVALTFVLLLTAGTVWAGSQVIDTSVSSTSTINGSSQIIDGTYRVDDPYIVQVWGNANSG